MEKSKILNIAAYKFVDLPKARLSSLRSELKQTCVPRKIKGTILLSREGINLFLAGREKSVRDFWRHLLSYDWFSDMTFKASWSDGVPFKRLVVKVKQEIISMGCPEIEPARAGGPHIAAPELKKWLDQKRDFLLLDTRNDYEFALGSFERASQLDIASFREFPEAAGKLPAAVKDRPVVMFCTGGIRCEKAAPLLLQRGFNHVYQLQGGILGYFEEVGGDHFRGECFVFDDRIALDEKLHQTGSILCERCQMPLTTQQQHSPQYKPGQHCPYCLGQNPNAASSPQREM